MSQELTLPTVNLPAELLQSLGMTGMDAMSGGVSGESFPSISLKNSRFRFMEGGDVIKTMDEAYLDVIIVGVSPYVNRTFYSKAYDPNASLGSPDCSSYNGNFPDMDVTSPMAASCEGCPKNVKQPDPRRVGKEHTPCSFSKSMVVIAPGAGMDKMWKLRLSSMTLYDNDPTGNERLHTYKQYMKILKAAGVQVPFQVLTRLRMDLKASVPKLVFEIAGVAGSTDTYTIEAFNQVAAFIGGTTPEGDSTTDTIQKLLLSGAKERTQSATPAAIAPPQAQPLKAEPAIPQSKAPAAVPGVTGGQLPTAPVDTPTPVPTAAPVPVAATEPAPVVVEATADAPDPNEGRLASVSEAKTSTSSSGLSALISQFESEPEG